MKKLIIFSILLFLGFIFQSCEDFLEENPRSVLNPEGFYTEESGLKAGVYAAFANLRSIYGNQENPFRLTILGTDIFTMGKAQSGIPFDFFNADLNSFSGEVEFIWTTFYKIINITNNVIASSSSVQMNEQEKARYVSEARFIRALSYYWLVQQFGDIPLNLQPTVGLRTESSRTSRENVYDAMVEDLKFAEENLEQNYNQWGRVRRGAAQHLLSKVYLLMREWDLAAETAIKVIEDPTYQLEENFVDIFHHTNQVNSEILFSVQYEDDIANSGSLGNRSHLYFTNPYSDIPGMTRTLEWGRPFTRYAPTNYLMSLFDDTSDTRSDIWRTIDDFFYNHAGSLPLGKNLGDPIDPIWRGTIEFHPSLTKYNDPTRANFNDPRGLKDFIVFRLGETYLIAAEALMMAGQTEEAMVYFNILRARAARPGFDLSIEAGDLNIEMILDERARELAGEMHRWFDLVRTGKALERIRANSANGQNIQEKHLLRPIPQNQIDRVTTEFPQNTGY